METVSQGGECRGDITQLTIVNCQLSIEEALCASDKTSNESPEKGLRCTKIRIGDRGGPSRAICVLHSDGISVGSLSFCLVLLPVRSLPSVFSHGRTQNHTSKIVPLRALKNGDRWLFSYGRVGTTVRTRRYDGSRSSVRSQSQVLLSVETGAADAFFALETV